MTYELQQIGRAVHVHGLFERPIIVEFETEEEAENALRRAMTLTAAELFAQAPGAKTLRIR